MPTIEDWQLQGRFQRRPLDEEEIAYINVSSLKMILLSRCEEY